MEQKAVVRLQSVGGLCVGKSDTAAHNNVIDLAHVPIRFNDVEVEVRIRERSLEQVQHRPHKMSAFRRLGRQTWVA